MAVPATGPARLHRERLLARRNQRIRLVVPDAGSPGLRRQVCADSTRLDPDVEADALDWIEAVSDIDDDSTR